ALEHVDPHDVGTEPTDAGSHETQRARSIGEPYSYDQTGVVGSGAVGTVVHGGSVNRESGVSRGVHRTVKEPSTYNRPAWNGWEFSAARSIRSTSRTSWPRSRRGINSTSLSP